MSNEIETQHAQLKANINRVVQEIFKQETQNKFTNINYVFSKSTSYAKQLKQKISVFEQLDVYSQTFVTIHTRAKIALREIKNGSYDFNSFELLRMIMTLPNELKNRKLKSVEIKEKIVIEKQPLQEEKAMFEKQSIEKQEQENKKPKQKRARIAKPETSGRKHYAKKIRDAKIINTLETIDL